MISQLLSVHLEGRDSGAKHYSQCFKKVLKPWTVNGMIRQVRSAHLKGALEEEHLDSILILIRPGLVNPRYKSCGDESTDLIQTDLIQARTNCGLQILFTWKERMRRSILMWSAATACRKDLF